MIELSILLTTAVDQTERGDPECGYLVGELLAYLFKRRQRLCDRNESFRRCYLKWESSRVTTKRSSLLRPFIHNILARAVRERRIQQNRRLNPGLADTEDYDSILLSLPDLTGDPRAVSEWTDKIVYPAFQLIESDVATISEIENIKKAFDENGKFQLSRLKPLIKQNVARIAALPKLYYFEIW